MSKIVDDGLKHFRHKLAYHTKNALLCKKEIARLEALKASKQDKDDVDLITAKQTTQAESPTLRPASSRKTPPFQPL